MTRCWSRRARSCFKIASKSEEYASDIEVLDDVPSGRFARLYSTLALNNAINGLIRMSALRRTRLVDTYRGADIVLMGHLALLGKFRLLDQRLFYRRMEPATATALQDTAGIWKHHYPKRSARTCFKQQAAVGLYGQPYRHPCRSVRGYAR